MSVDPQALDALFAERYSCRGFRPDPVPSETISDIVATARRAPSWCNAQPWQLVITRGEETDRFRAALEAEVASGTPKTDLEWPRQYTGIYQERRRACGFQLYDAVGIEKGDRAASAKQMLKNFSLFGAPHVAVVSSPAELGAYGAMDTGGFVTAFTVAAQTHGVASIPQAAIASYAPFLRDYFGIGDDRLILCGISFGYADHEHPANQFRTDRASVDDIVDWRG